MSARTCLDCGNLYGPSTDAALCEWCRAEHNSLRTRMARLVEAERRGELEPARWDADDLERLRAERDRLRPLPVQSTRESGSRVARRFDPYAGPRGLWREVVVPEVATDRWGRPCR